MVKVPLTQGAFALIDDEDAQLVLQYKWCMAGSKRNGHFYAWRSVKVKKGEQKNLSMHRFLMNPPPGMCVDHINNDGLDNRRANLRIATHAQNIANGRFSSGVVPFRGVCVRRRGSVTRYEVKLKLLGKRVYIGTFTTPEEAARAYDAKAREVFGEFARTNF